MNVHFRTLTVVTVFGGLALSQSAGIAGEERGFYAGADLGGAIAESTSLREFPDATPGGDVKFHPGARLSLNGGYRFNNWFSLGAETGVIVNVRGEGMVFGIECGPLGSLNANQVANAVVERCYLGKQNGDGIHLLGPLANCVIRISPPMCMTDIDAHASLQLLFEFVSDVAFAKLKCTDGT